MSDGIQAFRSERAEDLQLVGQMVDFPQLKAICFPTAPYTLRAGDWSKVGTFTETVRYLLRRWQWISFWGLGLIFRWAEKVALQEGLFNELNSAGRRAEA